MKLRTSVLASLTLVVALGIAGCTTQDAATRSADAPAAHPSAPASSTDETAGTTSETTSSLIDPSGNVVLFVDNGSIPGDTIDIRVEVDGQVVVDRLLPSARDSAISPSPDQGYYVLKLPRGKHVLTARTRKGAASLERTFEVAGRLWIAVAYSYNTPRYGTPSPRELSVVFSDKEMGRL